MLYTAKIGRAFAYYGNQPNVGRLRGICTKTGDVQETSPLGPKDTKHNVHQQVWKCFLFFITQHLYYFAERAESLVHTSELRLTAALAVKAAIAVVEAGRRHGRSAHPKARMWQPG